MPRFPRNFSREEFEAASNRPLTPAEVRHAWELATFVLQPARRVMGPIVVTSFVRDGDSGCHGRGKGVDVVSLDAPLEDLHDWIATHKLEHVGELLLERSGPVRPDAPLGDFDHVHLTLAPCGGEAEVLTQSTSGDFEVGELLGPMLPLLVLSGLLALTLWLIVVTP